MNILSLHRPRWTVAGLFRHDDRGVSSMAMVPTLTNEEVVRCRARRDGSLTAVGTDAALHYRTPGGAWRRVAWIDVAAANWSTRTGRVHLEAAPSQRPAQAMELAVDATLAAFAADRIAHLRIIRRRVEFVPEVFGIVEATRASDRAAPRWRVHLEDPAQRHNPSVQHACRDVVSELRSLTGC